MICHFYGKMHICPQKGQKGAKVGGAVGKNQLFCILLKIGSLDFFNILNKVKRALMGINCPKHHFSEKFSFSKKMEKRVQK